MRINNQLPSRPLKKTLILCCARSSRSNVLAKYASLAAFSRALTLSLLSSLQSALFINLLVTHWRYFISRSVCRDALIHLLYESLMYWVARPRREPSFYDNESIEPATV